MRACFFASSPLPYGFSAFLCVVNVCTVLHTKESKKKGTATSER